MKQEQVDDIMDMACAIGRSTSKVEWSDRYDALESYLKALPDAESKADESNPQEAGEHQ